MPEGVAARLGRMLVEALGTGLRSALRARRAPARARRSTARRAVPRTGVPTTTYAGTARLEYTPHPDGHADPGEIVWTWVPFEEDPRRGKDRPVLVVGHDGAALLALMLTSKDHDRDAVDEARYGRHWMDIGSGAWDPQRRPSEVRLDRVLMVDPAAVRREGATLDRATFDAVAAGVRRTRHWPR